ncbi:hydrolase 2, exosortase A system-associated [Massilia sp. RP-1-19]|uniref:Hydrolase 2, exosortase A system-associated n=1 Tax=Massilia polaris TaxID=2728846 RepID=A0A848HNS7_9BURK|nr:hydrolase 2, exosortase A system-associated [Massilia polaris]NML60188.1 hydrolase 2, exosortase A system-associated [Massilia polaris]
MNAPLVSTPRVEAFFFDADPGTRFSLYHAPDPNRPERGAILYVHPFAEELNRTRRMALLQARHFAALGYAVLQIDLFGCGDSCGDFSAARWDVWRHDLGLALDWLRQRSAGPVQLWGLRLGGLLALDFACGRPVDGIILWQPFMHGRTCINQFLRRQLAAQGDNPPDGSPRSTAAMRAHLAAHGSIEVAGYALTRELAQAIDACDAAVLEVPACPIHWFASGAPAPIRLAASAARLTRRWGERGATVRFHQVDGAPFWTPIVDAECPALLAATSAVFGAGP